MRHVVVVGASLAGLSTARALRAAGYDGLLTVIGDEPHRPYDRPPLSKDFLRLVESEPDALEAEGEDLAADWRLGVRAVGLSAHEEGGASIALSDGSAVTGDRVVLATGAVARPLPGAELPGVHRLRTADDARALRADLHAAVAAGTPVVVVGGGFIGSEVAATARELGCAVTLVVVEDVPLREPLGPFADALGGLHVDHGVHVHPYALVDRVRRSDDWLEVDLRDGTVLPAGVVVLGIGARPATDWLAGSGVELTPGGTVRCDGTGATSLPGVWAVGDCSAWYEPGLGAHHPIEHWTSARERGAVVAAHIVGAERIPPQRPPYVWSDLYGHRLQLAGHRELADAPPEHDVTADGFVTVFRRAGAPVAVLALDRPREFAAVRRRLVTPVPQGAAR